MTKLKTTPNRQSEWDEKGKEKLLNSLAIYKSKFSQIQFDRHWLEWVDQAFDNLLASYRQKLKGEVEAMKPPYKTRPGEYNQYNHGWQALQDYVIKLLGGV